MGGERTNEPQDGQVSETAAMTPAGGADGTPGTDDGIPPAADAQHLPGAEPRSYPGDADR